MSHAWSAVQTVTTGFEADLVIARLEAEDIPAARDEGDTVGLLGFGYQGITPRGVTVRVPPEYLEAARAILAEPVEPPSND